MSGYGTTDMALTEEDFEIWLRWSETDNGELYRFSRDSDRRDAQLMADAQHHPGCVAHWAIWRLNAVLVRGWRT
jgi:hypothetical protein